MKLRKIFLALGSLLLCTNVLAEPLEVIPQRIVKLEIPKKYLDASASKRVKLMIKYKFSVSDFQLLCNLAAVADLTMDSKGIYSVGNIIPKPIGTEMGCPPADSLPRKHSVRIDNLLGPDGKALNDSAWFELTDFVFIDSGEVTNVKQSTKRGYYGGFDWSENGLKKFKTFPNVSVDAIIYELDQQNPTPLSDSK